MMPRIVIEINGLKVCEIVKKFMFFANKYKVEGLPWQLEGDFIAHDYEVLNDSQVAMKLSKKPVSWGDSYELDIADSNHELLCLCIALAIDCAFAVSEQRKRQWFYGGLPLKTQNKPT